MFEFVSRSGDRVAMCRRHPLKQRAVEQARPSGTKRCNHLTSSGRSTGAEGATSPAAFGDETINIVDKMFNRNRAPRLFLALVLILPFSLVNFLRVEMRWTGDLVDLATASIFHPSDRDRQSSKIEENPFLSNGCQTTFGRKALPQEERDVLVFTAPPKFDERSSALPESLAKWRDALRGRGTFVVFTDDPRTREVCQSHGIPTMCVQHTDDGFPRLDLMLERMHASGRSDDGTKDSSDAVVAFVNSDLIVQDFGPMHDFFKFLNSSDGLELMTTPMGGPFERFVPTQKSKDFFVVANRINILENGEKERHQGGGYDFWAWNAGPVGLLPFPFPPFRFPLATYDNWLLDMVIQSGERNAIDASELIQMYHPYHEQKQGYQSWTHAYLGGVTGVYINRYFGYNEPRATIRLIQGSDETKNSKNTKILNNIRHYWQFGTALSCPYVAEQPKDGGQFLIAKREIFATSPFNGCKETGDCDKRKTALMGTTTQEERVKVLPLVGNAVPQTAQEKTAAKEWRYTLDKQLSLHSDEDGYVLLTAVNYEYREHLMNFICMLNQLGMTDHYLIAALDEKMYAWGVRQGLPIYSLTQKKEGSKLEGNKMKGQAGSSYGTNHFKKITMLKSKAVLEILEKGYSVVWSDVDITWFKHPFEALADHMTGYGIAIQSNAPFVSNPNREAKPHHTVSTVQTDNPAGRRRLNSGLYVAPSNPRTVSAFREIVERAAKSDMTEQPHFDEVLCNQNSSDRGYDFCTYRGLSAGDRILKVQLLDRFMFPTGSVLLGDNNENVYNLGREGFMQESGVELIAAHNNWIEGEALKKERQVKAGWWFTDAKDTCFYPGDHTIV